MSDMSGSSPKQTTTPSWAAAERALKRHPVLKRVIKATGPCTLAPVQREPYEALVRAIAHQQVHGRAAEAILGPLAGALPGSLPAARGGAGDGGDTCARCGFSRRKVAAIRDIRRERRRTGADAAKAAPGSRMRS